MDGWKQIEKAMNKKKNAHSWIKWLFIYLFFVSDKMVSLNSWVLKFPL
jgi:hypothetical protein